MRILILDDDLGRHKVFNRNLIGCIVVNVTTAEECICELSSGQWDYAFLDHDLGGQTYVPSGPGTGYEVACWLRDHPDAMPGSVVIHSFNPTGAANMKAVLPSATYVPGAWDKVAVHSV